MTAVPHTSNGSYPLPSPIEETWAKKKFTSEFLQLCWFHHYFASLVFTTSSYGYDSFPHHFGAFISFCNGLYFLPSQFSDFFLQKYFHNLQNALKVRREVGSVIIPSLTNIDTFRISYFIVVYAILITHFVTTLPSIHDCSCCTYPYSRLICVAFSCF